MDTCIHCPEVSDIDLQNDALWDPLYLLLLSLVKGWVYNANVPVWSGQETDVAWDIVLSAIRKTFEYALNAQQNGITIASLKRLSIVIARNQFQDFRRKDYRLMHVDRDSSSSSTQTLIYYDEDDLSELVLERLYEAWLFSEVAKEIAMFPLKMRQAVLIDLAWRLEQYGDFYGDPTPLRQAFLDEGIHLEEFLDLLPTDPAARARHSSLVSLGYKRIAKSVCIGYIRVA